MQSVWVARVIQAELWAQRFGDDLQVQNYSARTVHSYVLEMRRFLRWLMQQGVAELASLTRQHLHAYRTHMFYQTFRGRKLKATSQAHRLNAVLAFVRFLARHDYLLVDISQGIELPRRSKGLPRVILSETETLRLLEAPDVTRLMGVRDRAILEVLYATAIRNSELRQLNLTDLDFDQRIVRIVEGKGQKSRCVPMGEEAWIWVEEYLARCRPQLLHKHSQEVVFLGRFGRQLRVFDVAIMVTRWGRRIGLDKHVTPHVLRHSCASHMLKRGANLRHLQVLLGHANVTTTEIYTRVEMSDLRKVLRRCHPRERQR